MKKIFIVICCLTFLCGCHKNKQGLEDILKEDNYIVVDVRSKVEYENSHVVDAINIEYNKIDKNVKLDKDKVILVYCQSGTRSKIAYQSLKDLGYNVYDLGAYDKVTLEKE